jgi:hypothetical protein
MKHIAPLLALFLAACAVEPIDEAQGTLVDVDPPSWCAGSPYSMMSGASFGTWASPTCKGDIARGAWSVSAPSAPPLPCSQFPSGEVFCVDKSSPIETIYYRDIYNGGSCIPYGLTLESWFVWRSCGIQPLPMTEGDEI